MAGDINVNAEEHPFDIRINKNSYGYDGQKFYHIALNPFDTQANELGISTNLAYRKQRILYPLLSHLIVGGKQAWVPVGLVLVNLICFLLLLQGIRKLGAHLQLGFFDLLLFVLLPGPFIALSRDLAEVMYAMFMVWIFYSLCLKKYKLTLLLSVAVLFTREESILFIGPCLCYVAFNYWTNENRAKWTSVIAFVPILLFALWKIYLYNLYGGYDNILCNYPLQGLVEGFQLNIEKNWFGNKSLINKLFPIYCGCILFWIVMLIYRAIKCLNFSKLNFHFCLSTIFVIWTLFLLFLPSIVYEEEISFARIISIYIFLCLFIIYKQSRLPFHLKIFSFFLCSLIVLRLIVFV